MSRSHYFLMALWVLLPYKPAFGQADPSKLTIDRIFNSGDFKAGFERSPRWFDASTATQLEPSESIKGFHNLIRFNPVTGEKTTLVPAEKLIPENAKNPLRVSNYSFSKDQSSLLLFTNTVKVWRQETRGDYWLLHLPTSKLTRLGGDAKPSTLQFAKFSPDGKNIGYVRDNNLWVESLLNNIPPLKLTTDGKVGGDDEIINGTFDWVYEEEFDCRDGWRWNPNGTSIAYWQLNTLGVPRFTLVDQTAGKYQKLTTFAYPKTGEQNSLCRVGVVPTTGGPTTWLQTPGDTRTDGYIPRMEWVKTGKQVILTHLNRLQNTCQVMLADPLSGSVKTVFTDKDDAWVDAADESMEFLEDGIHFCWISERDGWRHLYLINSQSGETRQITRGNFDAKAILKVDEKSGYVYFTASPGRPTEQYLYRMPLNPPQGFVSPKRITPQNQTGWNDYVLNENGNQAVWTHSQFGEPPSSALVDVNSHNLLKVVNDNSKLKETLAKVAHSPVEWFQVDIGDGFTMDGWLIKPPNFDPAKKYPILFHVYGEPAGQTVADKWGGNNYLWHLYLAQQGYIVASMDNRGTKTPKGRAWRKSVYRKIGVHASADQAKGARDLLKRPYIDPKRVAVWGWSGGGSMTLNLLFRFPEIYNTGMSVAPVPDMTLYDTIYQERYMGLPGPNSTYFKAGSPITHAAKLNGNLLLVHGTGDDNVHYQGVEKLMEILIAENKTFSLMAYPNRSHSINEGKGTSRHLYSLLSRFLMEKMPPS